MSPLKALAVDVERNLRSPLTGIRQESVRLGLPEPEVKVGIRSGDTPPAERRALSTRPPDILITTPESLFLMLTSATRDALTGVETVILDEVHAVAGTKRGAHLALSLERLDELLPRPARRIGLSATVRPVDEVARYLSPQRKVEIVQPPSGKEFDLSVVVPVEDLGELGGSPVADGNEGAEQPSIWPHVEERIADLVQAHRSTIVFANSRRLAERLCNRLNEIAYERATGEPLDEHHAPAELMARLGRGPGRAAGPRPRPPRLGLQGAARPGRGGPEGGPAARRGRHLQPGAGHRHGRGGPRRPGRVAALGRLRPPARRPRRAPGGRGLHGRGLPQVPRRPGAGGRGHRADAQRLHRVPAGPGQPPGRPGAAARRHGRAGHLAGRRPARHWSAAPRRSPRCPSRRSRPSSTCSPAAIRPTPSRSCARAWCGTASRARSRAARAPSASPSPPAARSPTAGSSGSSSPAPTPRRAAAGSASSTRRWCTSPGSGDVFTLGTSSWRIEDITRDRVLVSPAPGVPGRLPFWKGDQLGRPLELGRAVGAFLREVGSLSEEDARLRLLAAGLDAWAADNVLAYLAEQREACGHVPDDRTIVVERFRDELGDWRVVVHSPFGAQVHAPWALALGARLSERYGMDAQVMHADDGIVLRLPDADLMGLDLLDQEPDEGGTEYDTEQAPVGAADVVFDKGEVDQIVTDQVGGSALFASRFRECAARALLLPAPQPGQAHPAVAAAPACRPAAPGRERVRLVPDRPGSGPRMPPGRLRRPGSHRADGRHRVPQGPPGRGHHPRALPLRPLPPLRLRRPVPVRGRLTARRAPRRRPVAGLPAAGRAAGPGGAARAARRRGADRAGAGAPVAHRGPPRQGRRGRRRPAAPPRPAHRRRAGRARRRARSGPGSWPAARRAIRVRIAGADHWAAIEDAGRLRDALGTALPVGVPEAFTEPVKDPLGDLLARYARTHGPFTSATAAARFGLGVAVTDGALHRLAANGRVVQGEFHPAGIGQEWCDATVLRRLRRRSLAALRHELEPVPPAALAQFLPQWQHMAGPRPARHRRTGARGRAVAGRLRARLRPGEAGPARPGSRTTPPRCSTS